MRLFNSSLTVLVCCQGQEMILLKAETQTGDTFTGGMMLTTVFKDRSACPVHFLLLMNLLLTVGAKMLG